MKDLNEEVLSKIADVLKEVRFHSPPPPPRARWHTHTQDQNKEEGSRGSTIGLEMFRAYFFFKINTDYHN